jgi:pyruvate, water dikinase
MGRFWQRVLGLLSPRAGTSSLRQRFDLFQTICAENDRFLKRLSQLMELEAGGGQIPRGTASTGRKALCAAIRSMATSMVAMAPGCYDALLSRLAVLEAEAGLRAEVDPATLPVAVGPDDEGARRRDLVGGKAANLAALRALGSFAIPPFFVVSRRGYHLMLDATGRRALVADLERGHLSGPELRAACEALRRAILETEVPAPVAEAILAGFEAMRGPGEDDLRVAVRSSATVEDGEFSFAGQFETVLEVRGEGLLEAYRRVVASKYRVQAVRYAQMSGYPDDEVSMPVLFMKMVRARRSGVAYSRDPEGAEQVLVSAYRGLAESTENERVTPDRFVLPRGRFSDPGDAAPAGVGAVARMALDLERHFGSPQDVEWAVDEGGALFLVQSRPLRAARAAVPQQPRAEGHRVLLSRAERASGGIASGRVVHLLDAELAEGVASGAVLVVPTTSPRLAGIIGRVAAIVAESGSPTGHMATVAREFQVPTLVGAQGAMALLGEGLVVTVDAWSGKVYEGEVPFDRAPPPADERDSARESLAQLLEQVAPLLLDAPDSPGFTSEACRTLHDVARFVHQKAMAEMFRLGELPSRERREARRLRWSIPMEVLVLDLGGGLAEGAGRVLAPDQIASVPFLALIEGMTDPRLRWSGPVGFDLRGFMSVVVRSAADDQRYGEPSFAICSREFIHLSSRLAYHFATVDAMCTDAENQNYARFVFFGGAAIAERREWRAHFLAVVLRQNGFEVQRVQDRVEAVLGKRRSQAIEEAMVLVGRLMAATRHLDMVMDSQATAEAFAASFLSGDFGFELVRKGVA